MTISSNLTPPTLPLQKLLNEFRKSQDDGITKELFEHLDEETTIPETNTVINNPQPDQLTLSLHRLNLAHVQAPTTEEFTQDFEQLDEVRMLSFERVATEIEQTRNNNELDGSFSPDLDLHEEEIQQLDIDRQETDLEQKVEKSGNTLVSD